MINLLPRIERRPLWIALVLATLLTTAGRLPAAWAQEELFVANTASNSIAVYSRTASGDTAPIRTLSGPATGLNGPGSVTVDMVNSELLVAGFGSITVYPRSASGNTAPLRTLIAGGPTLLTFPRSPAVDTVNDELIVANFRAFPRVDSLTVHARTANGETAPLRWIAGPTTGLTLPTGVVLDKVNNELVVVNAGNDSITVYARTASGDAAPLRTLSGPATGLAVPTRVALDTVNSELVVTNGGNNSITVYARTATGNTTPLRTIAGPATGLNGPTDLVLDVIHNELFVTNPNAPSILVYPRTADGNTAPLRTLQGPATGLSGPTALALATGDLAMAFLTRLYQQVLNRAPEPAGLDFWLAQLASDGAVARTVLGIFQSAEFLGRQTSDDQYLQILYRTFLDRDPDPAGFAFLLGELQSGRRTRENLLDGFMFAPEFAGLASFLPPDARLRAFVTLLYQRLLERNPDPAGLQFFLGELQQSQNLLPTIQQILASPEFQSRQTSDPEFVTLLYRLILRRTPDAPGLAFWVGFLTQGGARDQLVVQFAAAPEFQAIQQGLFPSP